MKVLVVDDLYACVQDVLEGVNWQAMGVEQTFAAYSVAGAKEILNAHSIQLLLCDIEMPPGSGLDLFRWIRAQGMDVECIFLSSHAEFEYARTAITIGGFDYLLQPARYEDIEAAVRRAIAKIEEKRRTQDAAQYGLYWREKQDMLAGTLLMRFLQDEDSDLDGFLEDMRRLGVAIGRGSELCLLLMQVQRRQEQEDMEALRAFFFGQLKRTEHTLILTRMEDGGYLAMLFGGDAQWAEIVQPLREMTEGWQSREPDRPLACYVGERVTPLGLHAQWKRLLERKRDNVAGYSGVFIPEQKEEILRYVYTFLDMGRWARQLAQGECEQVRAEALGYLKGRRDANQVTAEFLATFYQDFVQMFLAVAQEYRGRAHEILYEAYPLRDFLQAYTSYEKMVSLVSFAIDFIRERVSQPGQAGSPVERAVRYIQQNIEKDLRRNDVAEAIFMNGDYLSRLVKKAFGVSLGDLIVSEKMRLAASLLGGTNIPVGLVASKVGYSNFSYFSQVFKKKTGLSPNEYRQAQRSSPK